MFRPILLLFLSVFLYTCAQTAKAQSGRKIRIVNANSLEYSDRMPDARRLIGNVAFEHQGSMLYCDSAYFYESSERMDAFSNVRIVNESVTITGNKLEYDGKTKMANVIGNVKLRDGSSTLSTAQLQYDMSSRTATYTTGGNIINNKDKNTLTSVYGQYRPDKKLFYFRKNVKLVSKEYTMTGDSLQYNTVNETAIFTGPTWIRSETNTIYCENGFYDTRNDLSEFGRNARIISKGQEVSGDKIFYDRKKKLGRVRQNAIIRDSANQLVLTGNYADYFEANDRILMTDRAAMEKIFGKDTLYVHGDTLLSITDTLLDKRSFYAFHHVRFYKRDFQGKCDSLTYTETDSLMRLFGRPVLWNEKNQLLGDSVRIQLANDELETLYLRQNAFIISEVDTVHYNQIKGKDITGHFINSELRKVNVRGNGQSVYYAEDDKGRYIGINKAECSDMVIFLDSNEVSRITFLKKPDAQLLPLEKANPDELKLKNFRWYGALRPKTKDDIFLRPAEPEEPKKKRKR